MPGLLRPYDIVFYDQALWVVSSAYAMDDKGRQLVNLCQYNRKDWREHIPADQCRRVEDEEDLACVYVCAGLGAYGE